MFVFKRIVKILLVSYTAMLKLGNQQKYDPP